MTSPTASHRALRILLYAISVLEAIAGIVLVFAPAWGLSLAPQPFSSSSPGFVFLLVRGIGIVALALAYLMCVTARDPVRYIAVIDTLIFLCAAAALLEIYGVATQSGGLLYPGWYLVGRAVVQVALALVLLILRPKGATGSPG